MNNNVNNYNSTQFTETDISICLALSLVQIKKKLYFWDFIIIIFYASCISFGLGQIQNKTITSSAYLIGRSTQIARSPVYAPL